MTENFLLYVEDFKKIKFYALIDNVARVEVYQEERVKEKGTPRSEECVFVYHIVILTDKEAQLKLDHPEYAILDKMYSILNVWMMENSVWESK